MPDMGFDDDEPDYPQLEENATAKMNKFLQKKEK